MAVPQPARAGAPGTVFLKDTSNNSTVLRVDNNGGNYVGTASGTKTAAVMTFLTDPGIMAYRFDQVIMSRGAQLGVWSPSSSLYIGNLTGAASCVLHSWLNTTLLLDQHNQPACMIYLHTAGAAVLPPAVTLLYDLVVEGPITGLLNILQMGTTSLKFTSTGSINGKPGVYALSQLNITQGAVATITGATVTAQTLLVTEQAKLITTGSSIQAEVMSVLMQGIVHADLLGSTSQQGPGAGLKNPIGAGTGGGHGGNGGNNAGYFVTGVSYDSVFWPILPGSGGGAGQDPGGVGGGTIVLNAQVLTVDGRISADGGIGGQSAGGGSGGAIAIRTRVLEGSGVIRTNGGNCGDPYYSTQSSGGGGGRIALYYEAMGNWTGSIQAWGGAAAAAARYGGPGTVYLEDTLRNYRKLVVDNNGVLPATTTLGSAQGDIGNAYLTETGATSYYFDGIFLRGYAQLAVVSQPVVDRAINITVKYLTGDSTGAIHVLNKQQLDSSTSYANQTASVFLYNGGAALSPPMLNLDKTTLSIGGTLSGLAKLNALAGSRLSLLPTGRIGSTQGTFEFDEVRLMHNAAMVVTTGVTTRANVFVSENAATVTGANIAIQATLVHVIGMSSMRADAVGTSMSGTGAGKIVGSYGSGAGHGGNGGDLALNNAGKSYGSVYWPVTPGSGGGNGNANGGFGGGIINIIAGTFRLDGTLSVNGGPGLSDGGGGASAGSILIQTGDFSGYGLIQANGGSALMSYYSSHPGGGAGGRIAVYSARASSWEGTMQAFGGPANAHTGRYGGCGTIFTKDTTLNTTRLVINNNGVGTYYSTITNPVSDPGGAYLTDGLASYHFDEVNIAGKGQLSLVNSGATTITIAKITGDSSGSLHIPRNVTLNADTYLGSWVPSPLYASIYVYQGGVAKLPSKLSLFNVYLNLQGTAVGLAHVECLQTSKLILGARGNTEGSVPGQFSLNVVDVSQASSTVLETDVALYAGQVTVQQQATLSGGNFFLSTPSLVVGPTAAIHADGMSTNAAAAGPGRGKTDGSVGTGAGHGGNGGGTSQIGRSYGNVYWPVLPGSGSSVPCSFLLPRRRSINLLLKICPRHCLL
eukprot:TRINITY_DN8234_c0_g1_i5.p1 TRINITY_DN8234_c0_g1~~TRINITY_DN8234_c0_g1_i5.p1  ORF type:complete len:1273 (-),score=284.34 TRINITY_DN8234_c0_g1_i5:26-3298(-)